MYVIEYRYGREKSGIFPWIWNQEIPIFIKQLTTCDIQCIVLAGLHPVLTIIIFPFINLPLSYFLNFPLNTRKMCSAAER